MTKIVKNSNNKWWQLFKTGTHISSSGKEFNADENNLDEIITATKNRSYANDEIPICIGHKKDDSPKWGAFKKNSFKRTGDFLQGKYEYLVSEFAEAIERKMFDKVSIALYPDNAIKHVAILGVTAPAIKDLEGIELAADEEAAEEYEFAEVEISSYWFGAMVQIIRNLKNFLISKYPLEEVEKAVPENTIPTEPPRIWTNEKKYFQENKNEGTNMDKTTEQITQEFQEKLTASDNEKKELLAKLNKANTDLLNNEINMFCESDAVKKKITPALKPHVTELLKLVSGQAEYEFSEGDATVKITPADALKKIIAALPDMEFNEVATKENAAGSQGDPEVKEFAEMNVNEESMELHKKALQIQSVDKCSYAEAVRKAIRQ